jgi:hypothetical protein
MSDYNRFATFAATSRACFPISASPLKHAPSRHVTTKGLDVCCLGVACVLHEYKYRLFEVLHPITSRSGASPDCPSVAAPAARAVGPHLSTMGSIMTLTSLSLLFTPTAVIDPIAVIGPVTETASAVPEAYVARPTTVTHAAVKTACRKGPHHKKHHRHAEDEHEGEYPPQSRERCTVPHCCPPSRMCPNTRDPVFRELDDRGGKKDTVGCRHRISFRPPLFFLTRSRVREIYLYPLKRIQISFSRGWTTWTDWFSIIAPFRKK